MLLVRCAIRIRLVQLRIFEEHVKILSYEVLRRLVAKNQSFMQKYSNLEFQIQNWNSKLKIRRTENEAITVYEEQNFILYWLLSESSSKCSAQWQLLHFKRRNLGCSSAEGRSSTANSVTKAEVLHGIE